MLKLVLDEPLRLTEYERKYLGVDVKTIGCKIYTNVEEENDESSD